MGDKCKTKTATMSKRTKTKTAVTSKKRRLKVLPFVLVKTKTEDGGSKAASSTVRKEGRDAFLHYSNNTVRMRHLLGLDDAEAAINEDIRDHLDCLEFKLTKTTHQGKLVFHSSFMTVLSTKNGLECLAKNDQVCDLYRSC